MLDRLDYDPWDGARDPGLFDRCQSLDEVLLVMHRLGGLEAVNRLLAEAKPYRQTLREAANKLELVGLKALAQLARKHARRAKSRPITRFTGLRPAPRHRTAVA